MRCNKCGKKLDDNTSVCPICGQQIGVNIGYVKSEPSDVKPHISASGVTSNANSNRCIKCGKILGDNVSVCPICGHSISGTVVSPVSEVQNNERTDAPVVTPEMPAQINQRSDTLTNKAKSTQLNKIIIFIIFIIVVAIIALCVMYFIKNSLDPDIEKLLPNEVFEYRFDWQTYKSDLSNIEIIRSTIENNIYNADLILTLNDDNFSRELKLSVTAHKYDNGGWKLELYSFTEHNTLEWKEASRKQFAERYLNLDYFDTFSLNDSFCKDDNTWNFNYNVKKDTTMLDLEGVASVDITLHDYNDSFPITYGLYSKTDSTELNQKWKVDGVWEAYVGGHSISLELTSNEEKILWNGSAGYLTTDGKNKAYADNGVFNIPTIDIENIWDTELNYSFWIGYPYVNLKISTDSIYISAGALAPSSENYIEMKKE